MLTENSIVVMRTCAVLRMELGGWACGLLPWQLLGSEDHSTCQVPRTKFSAVDYGNKSKSTDWQIVQSFRWKRNLGRTSYIYF